MQEDNEDFLRPVINQNICISCHLCEKTCPVLRKTPPRHPVDVYAAFALDNTIREQSTSGGIFTLLARHVFAQDGIVYGAGWDSHLRVIHKSAECEVELADLRGSKYVQSDLNGVFQEVKDRLQQGRPVLFSGTPCQIAGLRSYLHKQYDNLFCVEVICWAVPSPKAFQAYMHEQAQTVGRIIQIAFRDKRSGWHNSMLTIHDGDGVEHSIPLESTLFGQGFFAHLFSRPSCHACPFRNLRSGADVTIGDFWGIENTMPEMDDNKGTSVVLINTEIGRELYNSIAPALKYIPSTYEVAKQGNVALHQSPTPFRYRALFFKVLANGQPFSAAVHAAFHPRWHRRAIEIFKQAIQCVVRRPSP